MADPCPLAGCPGALGPARTSCVETTTRTCPKCTGAFVRRDDCDHGAELARLRAVADAARTQRAALRTYRAAPVGDRVRDEWAAYCRASDALDAALTALDDAAAPSRAAPYTGRADARRA